MADSPSQSDNPLEPGGAIASQQEIAAAPALQNAAVGDSITTHDTLQTSGAQTPWFQTIGIAGLENVSSEDDARERLRNLERAAQVGAQAYQQSQYYAQELQRLQSQLQSQQPAPAQKQPEQPKKPWDPVAFDDSWHDWIDPTTKTWRENTPYNVIAGYQKYARAQQEFINRMYTKPEETLAPYIEDRAKGLVTPLEEKIAALESALSEQRRQQEIATLLAPYRSQFYSLDQAGQVQRDQFGNAVLTPQGQSFNNYAVVAQQIGLTDPRHVAVLAMLAAQNEQLRQSQQAPAQPAATPRQQHDAAIYPNGKANGANRIANRGNTINASAGNPVKQNENVSFETAVAERLRALRG